MMEWILFFAAMAFSTLGTLAGFGGGAFIVPFMTIGFGIPIEVAIGVTAISLFPASLVSSLFNWRRGSIDWRMLVALEIPAMAGAFLGAHLTGILPTRPLEIVFAIFLSVLAFSMLGLSSKETAFGRFARMLNALKPRVETPDFKMGLWVSTIFGGGAGVIAGLFGIGGGLLKTPIMIHIFRAPLRMATATSTATIMFTSLSSGFTHYRLGHTQDNLLWSCALGFTVGGIVGSLIGVKLKDQSIQRVIAFSMVLAALAVLFL